MFYYERQKRHYKKGLKLDTLDTIKEKLQELQTIKEI